MTKRYYTVLIIAGSDSVGGAGIQADIKTCMAHGVYGMTAITAVTAQNTCGVRDFQAVAPRLLEGQLRAVIEDVFPDAVKIGMLPDAESVAMTADIIREYRLGNVVVDPVLVATSGDSLTSADTLSPMRELLMPLATVVTPNIPEASALTGMPVGSRDDMLAAARRLSAYCPAGAVLLKGGHGLIDAEGNIADLFVPHGGDGEFISHQFIPSDNTHGTGCTLSSAIASGLAKGLTVAEACVNAVEWLGEAIRYGADRPIGHGHGPVNHLWALGDYEFRRQEPADI